MRKKKNKMTPEEDRPKEWVETVSDLIRAKFNYVNCNAALKKKFGDEGAIGGQEYQRFKNKIDGGTKVDEKLDELSERKRAKPKKEKPKPAWTSGKQKTADSSKLAQIINMGVYQGMLPFCANQELKEEQVQEINPGGAVTGCITYYFPEGNIDHPLIILGIRVIILYVKFKSVCNKIAEVKDRIMTMGGKGGLKPGMKTDVRK